VRGAGVVGTRAVRSRLDGDDEGSPLPGFGRASRRASVSEANFAKGIWS
jgi:hypothetical protein